jgi:arylsulfatase A-like enzyme
MDTNNVLFITVDSLRPDHVGCYGYDRKTTPTIDSLAEEGTQFLQAAANGTSTPPSFASILSSTHPLMYGGWRYLVDDRPLIAQQFSNHGFDTVAFHSNPHIGRKRNHHNGFDTFQDTAEGSDSVATLKDRIERIVPTDSALYSLLRRGWHYFAQTTNTSAYAKADTITDTAVDWIEQDWDDDPFFLWLHYMDVHYPFLPPNQHMDALGLDTISKGRAGKLNRLMEEAPEKLDKTDVADLRNLYDGEIRFTDHEIGRLLEEFEAHDILDETAVFVTADHGEAFGEHDRFGHYSYPYDELIRVPLITSTPADTGETVDDQVSLIDLGPTMYDLTGLDTPNAVQGRSLLPLIRGDDREETVHITTSKQGQILSTRTPAWKCIWETDKDTVELFDLDADPDELTDVSEDNPETVERFSEIIEEYLAQCEQTEVELPEIDHSMEVQQRLEDLGYIE